MPVLVAASQFVERSQEITSFDAHSELFSVADACDEADSYGGGTGRRGRELIELR